MNYLNLAHFPLILDAMDQKKVLIVVDYGQEIQRFVPLHEPLTKQFDYGEKQMRFYYKGAEVLETWTPAQIGLKNGDKINLALA
jgi:hypothetical protein